VCEEAKKPGSKSARLQTSTFFELKNFNVLIDVSQDFEKQLKRVGDKKIDFVFLTHGHADAAYGLPLLANKKYREKFNPVIHTEKQTFEVAKKEMPQIAKLNFKFIEPYKKYNFEGWQVIPFRVEHAFNPLFLTLGYLFNVGKKRIAYASDFKKIPPKSKELIKGADLVILDCAAYNRPIPTHVSFPEILELVEELKFKRVYLTQVGIAWPHYEMAQKIIQKQAKNIFLAYDGLEIKI
jgi:phosphoribosyl 1,2-cyclic phosphate phosphodiesterase